MSASLNATKATAGKRAKRHDRDKYYRLAKEQGYRSRAAFKLLQINKKYKFLSKAKTVIDLCAAPGGWTQVARNSLPSTGTVIALDILPIRPIPNVITHVADITTGKGQSLIRQSMSGSLADVVLCDGAPNVGGAFEKDSYLQNEIVLHSLKCACQHLMQNGTFVTKVYRSADYTSLVWVLKQLFGDVEAVKPASSRQQSAEIFLVCLGFKKPKVIDERFFQPKHVFSQISSDKKAISVFDKDYTKHRRQREGYSEDLDATMRVMKPITEFIDTESPIEMLSESNGFKFDTEADKSIEATMTDDIRESCDDLKLLGKSEFKSLLQWRERFKKMRKEEEEGSDDDEVKEKKPKRVLTEEEREEEIMEEIREMKEKRIRKKKREKKKEREASAKLRRRKVMGMESNAQLEEEQEGIFSLDGVGSKVAHVGDVNLDNVPAEAIDYDGSDSDKGPEGGDGSDSDSDSDKMEDEMDAAYELFLSKTKNAEAKAGTRRAKRKKKEERRRLEEQAGEDVEQMAMGGEQQRYLELLSKGQGRDSDDDSGSSSDDGFFDEPEEGGVKGMKTTRKKSKGLLVDLEGEDADEVKARNFFADSIFEDEEEEVMEGGGAEMGESSSEEEREQEPRRKKQKKAAADKDDDDMDEDEEEGPITGEDVVASMPKTDKQKRHEKRLAANQRLERRDARRAKQKGEDKLEIVNQQEDDDDDLKELDEKTRARVSEARRLIKAGMGGGGGKDDKGGLEIAPKIEAIDDRTYGSDEEDYDSDDHARTLALGTMMLRKSKAKQLVDASYNRFSWNDPKDLPDWFQDDESRHYRPQLPLPPALVQKMKDRFMTMAAKPIAKVAEARARKSKRANLALKAAKKKAEQVAQSSEMSETQKLKAISKAMKGRQGGEGSGKTYVVAKKNGGKQGGKGVKLVDKRLKSDKRGMDRAKKKGKKGGLTGGKRRRHHS
ncbi:hypothetical protein TrVE_jg908 [Triparma verrucosa]|uniref:Putative rRNA methyltransferase n=1 Tax=Triparma verrucosa TaxID=1606542 RepID=A0A9W7FKM6_9STRA|nr:hypothetical protein TrVE_jg908 [Triparma verrucosa]